MNNYASDALVPFVTAIGKFQQPAHSLVENMSTQRGHPVENLCAKINFGRSCACFRRLTGLNGFFVVHFACATTVNA